MFNELLENLLVLNEEDSTTDIDIVHALRLKWNIIGIDYMEAVTGANVIDDPEKRARRTESGSIKGSQVQEIVSDMMWKTDFKSTEEYDRFRTKSDFYLEQAFPSNQTYSI